MYDSPIVPPAVRWYRVYCIAAAFMNLVLLGLSIWFVLRNRDLANEIVSAPVVAGVGWVCAPLSVLMAGVNLWLPFTKRLSRPWEIHFTNLVVGIGTCVLLPIALPVLLQWSKPEVKSYFKPQHQRAGV